MSPKELLLVLQRRLLVLNKVLVLDHYISNNILVNQVHVCISSSLFCVLINDDPHIFNLVKWETLFPLIFLRFGCKFSQEGSDLYLQIITSVTIFNLHLIFVDDLLIFTRGDLNSAYEASSCLTSFAFLLGLHANPKKWGFTYRG